MTAGVSTDVVAAPLAPKSIAQSIVHREPFLTRLIWGRGGGIALDSPPLPNPLPHPFADQTQLDANAVCGNGWGRGDRIQD